MPPVVDIFAENFAETTSAQTFSRELKLAPKQTIEIEMPVEAAANLGVTFMANPAVAVSLIDEKGVVVGKNSADSPLAGAMFRLLFTKKPVAKSVWKLRVENASDAEQLFAAFSWSVEDRTVSKPPTAD